MAVLFLIIVCYFVVQRLIQQSQNIIIITKVLKNMQNLSISLFLIILCNFPGNDHFNKAKILLLYLFNLYCRSPRGEPTHPSVLVLESSSSSSLMVAAQPWTRHTPTSQKEGQTGTASQHPQNSPSCSLGSSLVRLICSLLVMLS